MPYRRKKRKKNLNGLGQYDALASVTQKADRIAETARTRCTGLGLSLLRLGEVVGNVEMQEMAGKVPRGTHHKAEKAAMAAANAFDKSCTASKAAWYKRFF